MIAGPNNGDTPRRNGRNADGTFTKGNKAAEAGARRKGPSFTTLARRALEEIQPCGKTHNELLVEVYLEMALAGDHQAFKHIQDRCDPVTNKSEVSVNDTRQVDIPATDGEAADAAHALLSRQTGSASGSGGTGLSSQ